LMMPLMKVAGDHITMKEAIVMTWSGLRGAVAITLAIWVDLTEEIASKDRARFVFHIGGMAMLTTLVNAPLAKPLLEYLDMTSVSRNENSANMQAEEYSIGDVAKYYQEIKMRTDEKTRDERFFGHNELEVERLVPYVRSSTRGIDNDDESADEHRVLKHMDSESDELTEDEERDAMRNMRAIFARLLQHIYWKNIDEGTLPKASKVTRHLIYSTLDAIEDLDTPLHDFTGVLATTVQRRQPWPMMSKIVAKPPLSAILPLQESFPTEDRLEEDKVRCVLCHMQAHKQARQRVVECFGKNAFFRDALAQVLAESQEQCDAAQEVLGEVQVRRQNMIKSKMFVGKLIHHHLHKVHEMEDEGVISTKGAQSITHHLQGQYRSLAGDEQLLSKMMARLGRQNSSQNVFSTR